MKLSEQIKQIRTEFGLSQVEFAEAIAATPQAVSNWERGKNNPSMDTILLIKQKFGVNILDSEKRQSMYYGGDMKDYDSIMLDFIKNLLPRQIKGEIESYADKSFTFEMRNCNLQLNGRPWQEYLVEEAAEEGLELHFSYGDGHWVSVDYIIKEEN